MSQHVLFLMGDKNVDKVKLVKKLTNELSMCAISLDGFKRDGLTYDLLNLLNENKITPLDAYNKSIDKTNFEKFVKDHVEDVEVTSKGKQLTELSWSY